jgi:hypothetical protein
MQAFYHICYRIGYNVRRYVALAQSRGGAPYPAPNAVKVGVFLHSWCDAGL